MAISGISTPQQNMRIALAVLPFATMTCAVVIWIICDWNPLVIMPIGVAVALALYACYFAVSLRVYTTRTNRVGGDPTSHQRDIRALVNRLANTFTTDAAEFYSQMIMDPPLYTIRITDRISPTSRAYDFSRSMKIGVPNSLIGQRIPVPLDLIAKGHLVNHLRVLGSESETVSTLSQDATIAHSALAARLMVGRVRGGRYLKTYIDDIEQDVLTFLCRNDAVERHDHAFTQIAEAIVGLSDRRRDRQLFLIVVSYLQVLATHYPLVIYAATDGAAAGEELIAAQYLRIAISRRTIPVIGRGQTRADMCRDWLRAQFGIRPARVIWGLAHATKARSYHLECMGPEGSYLARQTVFAHSQAGETLLQTMNHRMLPRHGQRFSHLYIHNFRPARGGVNSQSANDLSYLASFYERPPGTTASSAVSAFAAAVLITVAAAARLRGDVDTANTDILAILLSLPVVASAWLGFGSGPSVFLGALGARIALLTTMVCSLAASALFLGTPAPEKFGDWWQRDTATAWIVLGVVIWFTFGAASLSWMLRVWTYRHFVNRASDRSTS